jgi:hypothetical protein
MNARDREVRSAEGFSENRNIIEAKLLNFGALRGA